jgi:hypothetical protein
MDIQMKAGAEFEAVRERIRKAPADIRKQINQGLKQATRPAEDALKHAVQSGTSKGTKGGGSKQRRADKISRSKRGTASKSGHGLRKNIAKGITRKISYSGARSGVRIRADSKYLPPSQKSLVKATNKGNWRHPVYGGKNWVGQTFDPAHWFDDTMDREGPAVAERISDVANQVMRKIQ